MGRRTSGQRLTKKQFIEACSLVFVCLMLAGPANVLASADFEGDAPETPPNVNITEQDETQPDPYPDTEPEAGPVTERPVLQIAETGSELLLLAEPALGRIPDFPPNRRSLYKVRELMTQHWMLTRLEVDKVSCHIYMDREGEPEDREVLGFCGYRVYQMWSEGVCLQTNDRETPCEGLTLHYIGPINEKLDFSIKLPGSVAYSGLVNCYPWGICADSPQMFFGGIDPLLTQEISLVRIRFEDGQEFVCAAEECVIALPPTDLEGMEATYYVTSSYGDDSLRTTFQFRNIDLGDGAYLFQLIDSNWAHLLPVSASQWKFFPGLEIDIIPWLTNVTDPDELLSTHEYAYLAGVLIWQGTASAADCPNGGLLESGAASACGIEAARDEVIAAQNRFDEQILAAAQQAHVPPQLLKGIIGQESQFWNGWLIEGEYGYGMLTDEGADMLLTWHVPTFLELCIPVFGKLDCAWGYSELGEYPQAYLRGLALQDIDTDAEFELIARTLAASVGQAGQLVRNVTEMEPGDLLDYREMWLISLGLYHGGSGCVGTAIEEAWETEGELSWGLISYYLPGDCKVIAPYPFRVIEFAETVETPAGQN